MLMRKELPPLTLTPRDYQYVAGSEGIVKVNQYPGKWHLFVSPTGTGKSIFELIWLTHIPNSVLVTPRVEIIAGMLDKLGLYWESHTELVDMATQFGIFTPIKFRNILAQGLLGYYPPVCILDECHHAEADSWKDIDMYLNKTTVLGATATPFRGTPQGTKSFRERWHTMTPVLTLPTAIHNNYCSLPTVSIWPLIDDDLVEISNGELKVSTVSKMVGDNLSLIVEQSKQFYCSRGGMWKRPTMYSVPTTDAAYALAHALTESRMPARTVVQDTKRVDRERIFQQVVDGNLALVQIDVVSEGVDLPIRRLIDIRPTMSPVKWLQQVGRIMRPTVKCAVCRSSDELSCPNCESPPEYICVCRNVERHGYLMEGCFPPTVIREAQEAFKNVYGEPQYSRRSGIRAMGMEGLGKFTTTPIHLLNGVTAFMYNLVHMDGYTRNEYIVLVHPNETEPLRAKRVSRVKTPSYETGGAPVYDWGRWQAVASLPDLKGCSSANPRELTERQRGKWLREAEDRGLNPHREVNNRSFQVLPLLQDLRVRL